LARLAQPFEIDPASGEPIRLIKVSRKPQWLAGGHGLDSTLADYLRFARMLAAGGTLDGVRILGSRTVAYMSSDHLAELDIDRQHESYLPGPGYGFGLGFAVRTQAGAAPMPGSIGDYSWSGLAGTYFWVDPKEDLIVIHMMQAPGQGERYRHMLRNLVYAAL
jgi:CubicO group peptidase (beta-lactamase class C family)